MTDCCMKGSTNQLITMLRWSHLKEVEKRNLSLSRFTQLRWKVVFLTTGGICSDVSFSFFVSIADGPSILRHFDSGSKRSPRWNAGSAPQAIVISTNEHWLDLIKLTNQLRDVCPLNRLKWRTCFLLHTVRPFCQARVTTTDVTGTKWRKTKRFVWRGF